MAANSAQLAPSPVPEPRSLVPQPEWGVVQASTAALGDRRLEAESYLSDGYGLRQAIEARPSGWERLQDLAQVWQPNRLKGIVVPPGFGTPFLAAGQVFEARPRPRKWLSLAKTPHAAERFVKAGTILVSCSGNVGRVTIAHRPHEDTLITHDLLRVQPYDAALSGWLYSFMRTATFRLMATGERYGHIIKHLEVSHLNALPFVNCGNRANYFDAAVKQIFANRDRAHDLIAEAEDIYSSELGIDDSAVNLDAPFTVKAGELASNRRRLDAYNHNPLASRILQLASQKARSLDRLDELCTQLFYPSRFRRAFGPNAVPYRSAEELFDLNPPVTKRVYAGLVPDRDKYMLHAGWIVMACSGQVYGLIGAVTLLDERHEGIFATHDLIRMEPDRNRVRSGYLLMALGHPVLGRPLVVREAYGTSIPHLDISDIRNVCIPRLEQHVEDEIAIRMEEAARLRSEADTLEDRVTEEAEEMARRFMRGSGPNL